MKVIIEIETDTQNVSERRERLNKSLEDTLLKNIKESVEHIVETSHCTTDYFKSCKVTLCE